MDMGVRGLQVCFVVDSLSQVIDAVQLHHLALLVVNKRAIREEALGGHGTLEGGTLAKDQGEIHDFEGNTHDN